MFLFCSLFFLFFKQKTAYEMRISDWSSDVCSSDLLPQLIAAAGPGGEVLLLADQGDYTAPTGALAIVAGGTASAPVTIRGVDSAGNAMAATIAGTRPEPFDPANPSGEDVFRLLGGANNLRFSDHAFENVGTALRVGGDVSNLTIEHVQENNVSRFFDNMASGANASARIPGR